MVRKSSADCQQKCQIMIIDGYEFHFLEWNQKNQGFSSIDADSYLLVESCPSENVQKLFCH